MNQPIFLHDHGQLVATHQRHLNDRLLAHGNAPIQDDGDCGPQTIKKSAYASWFLGALDGSVQVVLAGTIGPGVQSMIADPGSRVGEQRTRAAQRKGASFPFASGDVAPPLKHIITHAHGYGAGHDGVDLICDESAPIFALCDAKVIDVRSSGWWGLGAQASHGHPIADGDGIIQLECLVDDGPFKKGLRFGYGHAENATVHPGQRVKAGDRIGSAGFANAWHVHFMANGGGTRFDSGDHPKGVGDRDPMPFVSYALAEKSS